MCGTENFLERSTLLTLLYVIVPYGLLEHTGLCISNQISTLKIPWKLSKILHKNIFRPPNKYLSNLKLIQNRPVCVQPRWAGQKILKSQGKKLVKSNKIFSWNYNFGSFKLFPSSKIDFWPFLKWQLMEFGWKFFFMKLIYLISRVFWPGLF